MSKYLSYFLLIISSIFWYACAVETAPLGGPKDEFPPKIDSLKSTLNFQTNFEKQTIQLVFDEWINLKDAFNQIVVSPPLEFNPDVSSKGKKVKFKFHEDEVLKEDVTYTINFGESIQDFTEGNPASNYRFVFSTGPEIDSISFKGVVIDAATKLGAEDVFVLLYENLNDSVVYTERPYYFAKTDENGAFKFENLREDSFKLFALGDQNLNYIYDQESEGTGFLLEPIYLHDSLRERIQVEYFAPEIPLQYFGNVQEEYGLVKLYFNRSPYDADLIFPDAGKPWFSEEKKDSLLLHYSSVLDSDTMFFRFDEQRIDTIALKSYKLEPFIERNQTLQVREPLSGRYEKLFTQQALIWTFNDPIQLIDSSKLTIFKDSIPLSNLEIEVDSLFNNQIAIQFRKQYLDTFLVEVLPGFAQSVRGITNDSISQRYIIHDPEKFGLIKLQIDSLNPEHNYLVHLKQRNKIVKALYLTSVNSFSIEYGELKPGDYSIYIVEDTNKNRRWDPGSYEDKKFSELWVEKALPGLRANWELETQVTWEGQQE